MFTDVTTWNDAVAFTAIDDFVQYTSPGLPRLEPEQSQPADSGVTDTRSNAGGSGSSRTTSSACAGPLLRMSIVHTTVEPKFTVWTSATFVTWMSVILRKFVAVQYSV